MFRCLLTIHHANIVSPPVCWCWSHMENLEWMSFKLNCVPKICIVRGHLQHSAILYIRHVEARLTRAFVERGLSHVLILQDTSSFFSVSICKASSPLTMMVLVCPHIPGHSVCVKHPFFWLLLSLHCCSCMQQVGLRVFVWVCQAGSQQVACRCEVWSPPQSPTVYIPLFIYGTLWLNYHLFNGEAWFGAKWAVVCSKEVFWVCAWCFLFRACVCMSEKKHSDRLWTILGLNLCYV